MRDRRPHGGANPQSVPARAGIGLRACHHGDILRDRPAVGWFEAHSENYFADGGAIPAVLERIRQDYPVSLHGVGLGLGNAEPLHRPHLARLKRLVDRIDAGFVSEHVAWIAAEGRFLNDLLPLPYTEEALRHCAARIAQTQDFVGRRILIENPSTYLRYRHSNLAEWEFLAGLATESGCGVLLDVNNVYVSAMNHGFDPSDYLAGLPLGVVEEYHLAGHRRVAVESGEIRIDTHDAPVSDPVWALYGEALERFGVRPTLIEWDAAIPSLDVLQAEAARADAMIGSCGVAAA